MTEDVASTVREHQFNEAFIDLVGALAGGEDVIQLLETLVGRCAASLDLDSVGLLLADGRGVLQLMGASSDDARDLEVLQAHRVDGPCRDCLLTGRQVRVDDLADHASRWPRFVPVAVRAGCRSAHAVPLRLGSRTLGALGLFSSGTGSLDDRDLSLAQALADLASIALTQRQVAEHETAAQLQLALTDRVVIEQAKGVLAHCGHLSMTQAFEGLASHARNRDVPLSEVARGVVTRTLSADAVLEDIDARA